MILLLALSLSMDAFAISVSHGIAMPTARRQVRRCTALWLGLYFGGFQAGMTLLGALLGQTFSAEIGRIGGWIAFAILAAIGGKMLWGALKNGADNDSDAVISGFAHRRAFVLAIATSIDALAAGVSLAIWDVNLPVAAGMTGVVTAALSVLGSLFGCRLGKHFSTRAEIAAGVVLIALGIRSLF